MLALSEIYEMNRYYLFCVFCNDQIKEGNYCKLNYKEIIYHSNHHVSFKFIPK